MDSDAEIDSDEINVSKILRTEYVQKVIGFFYEFWILYVLIIIN